MNWVGLACAVVLGMGAGAQVPRPRAAGAKMPASQAVAAKDASAGEPLVLERLDTVYRYSADGTGSRVETRVLRVQNEAGRRTALVMSLPYPAESRRIEIVYLRVRKPNGTVVDTPPTDAQDGPAPEAQIAPGYGDIHVLQIGARGLVVGDRMESEVRTVIMHPEADGQFWGSEHMRQGGAVALERTVELRVPASRNVLVSSPKLPPATRDEGAEKVFRWTGSQLKKVAGPGDSAVEEDEGGDGERRPPIVWTTFRTWAEVAAWYRGLAGSSAAPTPELKARADGVVYGLRTPEEKIRALCRYVAGEVRSIDVAWGPGQYAPHPAGEVLQNLYGNSNDKNTVLVAMLGAEGLGASTALVGAGGEVDEAVPSPGWFNHVVTLTTAGAHGPIWLDSSLEAAPFGMLPAALRDRWALVIPAPGQAGPGALRRTPADLPFAAFNRLEAQGTLSATGTLQAHVGVTMRGDEELRYRTGFRTVGQGQWDRVTDFFVRSSGLTGDGSDTVVDRLEDTAEPLHFGFDLAKSPYGDWGNFRIVPLQPGLNLPLTDRKTAPDFDVELGGKRTDTAVSRITLPPGDGADLPEAQHLRTDFATLDRVYRLEKGAGAQVLVTEQTLTITADKVPVAQWPAYRKFLDDIGERAPWVQLTSAARPGAAAAVVHAPPSAGSDSPAAAQLVAKADTAIEAKRYDEATASLDGAKKVNPRQALLWSSYGVMARRAGRLDEAVADFQRELQVHPAEAFVSQMLAAALVSQGKTDEAVAALRAAVAVNPADAPTVAFLAHTLQPTDKAGAERALRGGLAASPDSLPLKLRLGTLLVAEGKREEGGALLQVVATSSQDPLELNDAAYAMADASLNLRVAEAAARRAIQLLNVGGARPAVGVADGAALRRTAQLVSTWDTYGWVLFREASYSEAEPWLRAGWEDSYGAEPGRHFAALLAKEGRAPEAARVLRQAAGGEAGDPVEEGTGQSDGRIEGGAARSSQTAPGRIPAGEHTFFVPGTAGEPAGRALFELEYALNAVPEVRLVSGDAQLASATDALRQVDTRTILPAGSPAHLLRRGVLHCVGAANCMLEMLSPRAALRE